MDERPSENVLRNAEKHGFFSAEIASGRCADVSDRLGLSKDFHEKNDRHSCMEAHEKRIFVRL